jgi:periplasmic divalent cation tolerance protein
MNDVIAVLTNVPDEGLARQIGATLVEQKLAACVNILGACESIYCWHGQTESAREFQSLIKTTRGCYPAVESAIKNLHPYEIPEIIVFPIDVGLPDYLDWVRCETHPP